jgi:CHAT domain-containing protein
MCRFIFAFHEIYLNGFIIRKKQSPVIKKIYIILCLFLSIVSSGAAESPDVLIAHGKAFWAKGNFEGAAKAWETALGLMGGEYDSAERADTALGLARAWQAMGHYSKALAVLDQHRQSVMKCKARQKALFHNRLGDLNLCLGDAARALDHLEEAEDIAVEAKDPFALACVLNTLGNVSALRDDFHEAGLAYQEALDLIPLAENDPDIPELELSIILNLLRINQKNDPVSDTMLSILARAERLAREMPDSHAAASGLTALGRMAQHILAENPADSIPIQKVFTLLDAGRQMAQRLEDSRTASYACGYLGQLYEDQGRYPEAIKITRQAVFYAQQANSPESLYLWQWQMGRLSEAQGTDAAEGLFREAINTLNPIRTRLFQGYKGRENAFYENVKPVYLGLARLLLDQARSMSGQLGQREKLREARDVMELLKNVELQEYFQDECVIAREQEKDIEKFLGPHTAVLYPIPFSDELVVLLSLGNDLNQFRVPISSQDLTRVVTRFRRQLQYGVQEEFLKVSQQLYHWLIAPFQKILTEKGVDTLIIAPDGPLRLIPFSVLHDGQAFLIETYAVGTVPALTLTDAGEAEEKKEDYQILLEGLSQARQGFAPLPNVGRELREINAVMGGKVAQDEAYTLENLEKDLTENNYAVVHLATHGVFGQSPSETFLLTHDGKLTMDHLERLIRQGSMRGTPVRLLSLSACQTALGDERAAFGLAGIAVKAGVSSAIATLWHVEDEAASLVMVEFYRGLKKNGLTKAKALQEAQNSLIKTPRYQHPAFWAPFLLIGNWR